MRVAFVSNYINHHQIPISNVLYEKWGNGYHFIQTEPMEEERIQMGWNADTNKLPYLWHYRKEPKLCQTYIDECDVVIFGGTNEECYIQNRLKQKKPIVRYSERLYREGQWKAISPRGLRRKYLDHTRYQNAPVCLLCAGGYVAHDFSIVHAYKGKRFKWGYFTEFEESTLEERRQWKENSTVEILWAARFIPCKRPIEALKAVKMLHDGGYEFLFRMAGGGEMEEQVRAYVDANNMASYVSFEGFRKPEEVRGLMHGANIFLFTSDYGEGWGAVLNEAMNSGCAVVASHANGAAPFLIKHGENGLIYKSGDVGELFQCIKALMEDKKKRLDMGEAAYQTISEEWNPQTAGNALVKLCEEMAEGKWSFRKEGPLSPAPVIKQRKMYRYLIESSQNK